MYDQYSSAGNFSAGQFPYDYLGLASVQQDAFTVGTSQGGPEQVTIVGDGYLAMDYQADSVDLQTVLMLETGGCLTGLN